MDNEQLQKLQAKIDNLDKTLQQIISENRSNLEVAKRLQTLLSPERIDHIAGFKCQARYLSSMERASEYFDIFCSPNNRDIWIFFSMSDSYTLGSILLQSINQITSRKLIEKNPELGSEEVFQEVANEILESKQASECRLAVVKIDSHSLMLQASLRGFCPILHRQKDKNVFETFKTLSDGSFDKGQLFLKSFNSQKALAKEEAYHYSTLLEAGSRIYLVGSEWNNKAKDINEFLAPLLKDINYKNLQASILEDLNYLLQTMQKYMQEDKNDADLSALALEVSANKLHVL